MVMLVGLMLLFWTEDVEDFSNSSHEFIGPWLSFMMIAALVLWMIYLFRFNYLKLYGNSIPLFHLRNFIFIFIGVGLIALLTRTLPFTRELKVRVLYPKEKLTWIIAVWTSNFSVFMHEYIEDLTKAVHLEKKLNVNKSSQELFLSELINAALKKNLHIETVLFSKGVYLDIGTPDNLVKAVRDPL